MHSSHPSSISPVTCVHASFVSVGATTFRCDISRLPLFTNTTVHGTIFPIPFLFSSIPNAAARVPTYSRGLPKGPHTEPESQGREFRAPSSHYPWDESRRVAAAFFLAFLHLILLYHTRAQCTRYFRAILGPSRCKMFVKSV